jgi:hypothetical protein
MIKIIKDGGFMWVSEDDFIPFHYVELSMKLYTYTSSPRK